jgi:hypothetical protein
MCIMFKIAMAIVLSLGARDGRSDIELLRSVRDNPRSVARDDVAAFLTRVCGTWSFAYEIRREFVPYMYPFDKLERATKVGCATLTLDDGTVWSTSVDYVNPKLDLDNEYSATAKYAESTVVLRRPFLAGALSAAERAGPVP